MARWRLNILTAVFCTVIVFGQSQDTTPRTATVPLIVPVHSENVTNTKVPDTTISDNPSPTIITDTTTIASNTSSTSSSTTTPSTTTTITTSTPSTTTTTTPSTTTTTTTTTTTSTPAPAPTPAPPVPPPQQNTWSYKDENLNNTCIVVQFAIQLNVSYTITVNNKPVVAEKFVNVPLDAKVTNGSCDPLAQWMVLTWETNNSTNLTNQLYLFYLVNHTAKTYTLEHLNITLAKGLFPNQTQDVPFSLGPIWQTPLATSYRCLTPTKLDLHCDVPDIQAKLTVSHLQEEAFRNATGTGFSAARECPGSDVPDAVPIAVGCALGGLVLIVLVAYLVARRRSAARGYLSM